MTRIKEQPTDSDTLPEYKSPLSRIVRSLRKGYDNLRAKLEVKSAHIQDLTGKLRDTDESREAWKIRAKDAEAKCAELQKENEKLQMSQKKKDMK
jgi:hypothetical protein